VSIVDRIVQLEREKKNRQDAAYAVVRALPPDERRAVLARLIDDEESNAGSGVQPDAAPSPAAASPAQPARPTIPGNTYIEKAVAFIREHPEGVLTREVAEAIGQDTSNVDGTLRQAVSKKLVEHRERKWFPAPPVRLVKDKAPKKTIRDLITEVFMSDSNAPRGAAKIFQDVAKLKADINRASVDGEISRMKKEDPPLIERVDTGTTGWLYRLTNGGQRQESQGT